LGLWRDRRGRHRPRNQSIDVASKTARPGSGRRYARVRRIGAVALVVGIPLAFATGALAKSSQKPAKCRSGYVRRTIRVAERRHGRIVRRRGKIVYTRVQRCVKATTKPPSPGSRPGSPVNSPGSSPTTPVAPSPPVGPVVSSPPSPTAPVNTAPPTIVGNATAGSTLSASTGSWTNAPTSFGYQWQRCPGGGSCSATPVISSTYALTSGDVGATIRVSVAASNGSGSASATSAAVGPAAPATSSGDPVVVAVGDIACAPGNPDGVACEQSATAAIAQKQSPSAVFVLGDNQYDDGSLTEYDGAGAYNSTWGIFDPFVYPVPGNHEYGTPSAAGYFQYFGARANPENTPDGYYSFNLGTWHIVALNSNCSGQNQCADASYGTTSPAQTLWLQQDLAHDTSACTLAMWHHPLFSYGWMLGSPGVADLWTALYNAHADVVLNGHDHLYERFEPQNLSETADSNGIREFVVGTGGESLNGPYGKDPPKTLQVSDSSDYGVLVLTLHASSYDWKFVNTGGATIDSGTTPCHGPSGAPAAVAHVARSVRVASLYGPALSFDARPIRASLKSVIRAGLAVAIHASRGVDVVVTASLRRGRRLHRIASFYETESQIPKPYSQILLRLPARSLQGMTAVRLVLRFAAVDSAEHRRTVTRTVTLR